MKKSTVFAAFLMVFSLTGCTGMSTPAAETVTVGQTREDASSEVGPGIETTAVSAENGVHAQNEENTMRVIVGDTVFTATLTDNSSAQALMELLAEGPLTIHMSDYGNMEKVGPIGRSLPENNEPITTEAGDIILYLGNSLVIYYDTNSWNFTRIGKIDNATQAELKAALGSGNVTVTFELGAE